MDELRLAAIADEFEVQRVRRLWAYARDQGDWDALLACFHPDATISISWYSGSPAGFVERSKEGVARRRPEERSKHWIGNARPVIRGKRATLETDAQILTRNAIDGHLFDCTAWGRFFDLLEKRDGVWRISRWTTIYEKDRLDPVLPGSVPAAFFEKITFGGAESGFEFMRFRQEKQGRTVPAGMIRGGTEDEARVKREGEAWLAGG